MEMEEFKRVFILITLPKHYLQPNWNVAYSFVSHVATWTESITPTTISRPLLCDCYSFDILVATIKNCRRTLKVFWCFGCEMSKFNFVDDILKFVSDIVEKLCFCDILCSTWPSDSFARSVPKSIFVLLIFDTVFLIIKIEIHSIIIIE